jgi:hypothetical protein
MEQSTTEETPGNKADAGKDRWDLLPTNAVREVVKVLTFGAKKYAPENWRKVPDARARYYAATWRHLTAWYEGERSDQETGLHHLGHAGCCVLFLLALDLEGKLK